MSKASLSDLHSILLRGQDKVSSIFIATNANDTLINQPTIWYFRKLLGNTIFWRNDNSKVNQSELSIIGLYLWNLRKLNIPLMCAQHLKSQKLGTQELTSVAIAEHFEVRSWTPEVQTSLTNMKDW